MLRLPCLVSWGQAERISNTQQGTSNYEAETQEEGDFWFAIGEQGIRMM